MEWQPAVEVGEGLGRGAPPCAHLAHGAPLQPGADQHARHADDVQGALQQPVPATGHRLDDAAGHALHSSEAAALPGMYIPGI